MMRWRCVWKSPIYSGVCFVDAPDAEKAKADTLKSLKADVIKHAVVTSVTLDGRDPE